MAFGTWFKNLITKGKALIKKAAPVIRKGVEIAKKVAPVIGGSIGNIINGVANVVDKGFNKVSPLKQVTFDSDSRRLSRIDSDSDDGAITIPQRRATLGYQGAGQRMIPMLK